MTKTNRCSFGFTLIEAVVSAGVFAVVVTSALGVYMSTMQLDAKTKAERTVQQNARFITEFLGKEIRNGSIDYSAFAANGITNISADNSNIFLVNQSLEDERIYLDGTNLSLTKSTGNTYLNSSGVKVTKFVVHVSPPTDPFQSLGSGPSNVQPSVTVALELTSNYGNRGVNKAVMNLQSTFAVRQYPSRDY